MFPGTSNPSWTACGSEFPGLQRSMPSNPIRGPV